ncbi:TonB-dependent receptor [Mangrovibacterium marinum]|uniref:Iron complex outermembrane receptor protein n=1 Tax=Mangrovibacterium marinum TaxID=1639118 RepID=A0A2T5C3M8_9BACT|nr:TonB-dependent receptor [Mangrovibacterium marinum]PTN09368.1 iron complex outermembrane receptor protein [Mangrovibacterium marinum]
MMNFKKILFTLLISFTGLWSIAGQVELTIVKGRVLDENGESLVGATVIVPGTNKGTTTNDMGKFILKNLPVGIHELKVSFIGYQTMIRTINLKDSKDAVLTVQLNPDEEELLDVEVFGERYRQPAKLDAITRMPLRPSEQIQSISVISNKLIEEQGVLTITDAVRNVPGVTMFGSYGGVRESMSMRGYRGVPVLKNGVRIDSDFRTGSALSEMQGVESIQVIKGSAAITQGVGNDLGSAGGVINIVTKTPKFENSGEVSVRAGSWGEFRPSFDVQTILDKEQTSALRLNGTFARKDNYRPVVNSDRVYINPSFEWRPDDRTAITLEMDYMDDNRTPVTSSVNLDGDTIEALYDMPHDKFLGLRNDHVSNQTRTSAVRITRQLTNQISLRAALFNSSYKVDNISTNVNTRVNGEANLRRRTLGRSLRDDQNSTFQVDFIGRDLFTGSIKHTFQLGFDYKKTDLSTTSYQSFVVDTIDVLAPTINNDFVDVSMTANDAVASNSSGYGLMAQEVMTLNNYLKLIMGLRYSAIQSSSATDAGPTTGDAWNPMIGTMISPIKNVNLFASYTTTTSLRSAANKMENGENIGPSTTRQWETGIKSDWLNNRLRFNLTYFDIITENLSYATYVEGTSQRTGYYDKAGDLTRRGVETELSGRIRENLQVMLGYAYLDAQYKNSPSYQDGSAPMNAPKHTANAWANYLVQKGLAKGLSVGAGIYYVGKRPVNDWSLKPDGHGSMTGSKPFDMPSYTTVNAQLAYAIGNITTRVYFNNIFDALGYTSYYRGGYINQIDPRNFSAVISYRF